MNPSMIDPVEASRLVSSLHVLLPRLGAVTAEFCRLVEYASPEVRLRMPSDERVLAVGIEEIMQTVEHPAQAGSVMARYARLAQSAGLDATHLPLLVASIQTAMAETAGYTWTESLEDVWTHWFDMLMDQAIESVGAGEHQAA
jgi:hemoglobin-like flavoprotein